jgi:phosphoserine aminotransferase
MRAYNFNAGPSALPDAVLKKAQSEMLNFKGTGMSVMELSHRSEAYDAVHNEAKERLIKLMDIPTDYEVLFLQGGASLQFTMIPMNFLLNNKTGSYALTGSWSEKAMKEAAKLGNTSIASSSKKSNYAYIPEEINVADDSAYLHITSNNTIYGTQWSDFPKLGNVPLIADMSSDILSRKIPIERFSMIYAGAQKNLGPSGVTVVIIKKQLLENIPNHIPTLLNYQTHANKNSMYNTPPTFSIYMLSLVLQWVEHQGGVSVIEERNKQKASLLYEAIDDSQGFYSPHASTDSRSMMNVTFTLENEELSAAFLAGAKENGFIGLNGHRSIGGCRASIYNSVPLESVQKLVQYMDTFRKSVL